MRSASRLASLLAAALLTLGIAPAEATSYYADSIQGNDGYDGSSPQYLDGHGPKRTVSAAIATAGNNGVIKVAAGSYGEALWDPGTKTLTLQPVGTVTICDTADTDNDGIPDYWEIAHGSNPNVSDAGQPSSDPKAHGLTNLEVYQNPSVLIADGHSTLNDGTADWWKVKYGFSLTDPTVANARLNCWTNRQKYENGLAATDADLPLALPYTANYQTNITCDTTDYWDGAIVGDRTHSDVLVVQNGGVLNDYAGYVGFAIASSNNTVTITDTNSAWNNYYEGNDWFGDVVIGWAGAGNRLVISNSASIYTEGLGIVGFEESSSNNDVLVTGSNSGWNNYWGATVVGWTGAVNHLEIRNAAYVYNYYDGVMGYDAASSSNAVLVTDSNSIWWNDSFLWIGWSGAGNSLVVSNGAFLYNYDSGIVGYQESSSGNTILLTDAGTGWENDYWFVLGGSGANNSLLISNGAYLYNYYPGAIGYDTPSTNNTVVITGSGSIWWNDDSVFVGYSGSGNRLVVRDGAFVYAYWDGSDSIIGVGASSSNNTAIVEGSGSSWWNGQPLRVGWDGAGNSLIISNGGEVINSDGYIGLNQSSSNNLALVAGSGSVWTNTGTLTVGWAGAGNTLVISNGGTVIDNQAYVGGNPAIEGYPGSSNNFVLVTDPGSLWTNETYFWIGYAGMANGLVVSNGGHVVSLYGSIGLYYSSSNNSVLVSGSGSVWSNLPRLCVGYGGINNSLFIENGGEVVSHNLILGYWQGSVGNVVEIDNGILTVANESGDAKVDVLGGTLTVNSGMCAVDTLLLTNGLNSALVYNGGTLTTKGATIANDAVLSFALGANSQPIVVHGDLTLGGALNITDAGGFGPGAYSLFTYTGTLIYKGLTVTPSSCFTYSIDTSSAGQVKLLVERAVTATPQVVAVLLNTPRSFMLGGANPCGYTFSVASAPAHGTLSGSAPNLTYTPLPGFNGADSFTFTAHYGEQSSDPATVSLAIVQYLTLSLSADIVMPGESSTCTATPVDVNGQPILDPSLSYSFSIAANDLTFGPLPTVSKNIIAFPRLSKTLITQMPGDTHFKYGYTISSDPNYGKEFGGSYTVTATLQGGSFTAQAPIIALPTGTSRFTAATKSYTDQLRQKLVALTLAADQRDSQVIAQARDALTALGHTTYFDSVELQFNQADAPVDGDPVTLDQMIQAGMVGNNDDPQLVTVLDSMTSRLDQITQQIQAIDPANLSQEDVDAIHSSVQSYGLLSSQFSALSPSALGTKQASEQINALLADRIPKLLDALRAKSIVFADEAINRSQSMSTSGLTGEDWWTAFSEIFEAAVGLDDYLTGNQITAATILANSAINIMIANLINHLNPGAFDYFEVYASASLSFNVCPLWTGLDGSRISAPFGFSPNPRKNVIALVGCIDPEWVDLLFHGFRLSQGWQAKLQFLIDLIDAGQSGYDWVNSTTEAPPHWASTGLFAVGRPESVEISLPNPDDWRDLVSPQGWPSVAQGSFGCVGTVIVFNLEDMSAHAENANFLPECTP
jgi:T5SS/PEP-CTERM-associated repeat protein